MKKYFLLFSSCFLGSCMYYSLAGSIPPHINSVAIPIVENQTAEFGMSESVTENLLAKFNEESILRVTDEESAVSVLNGTIVRVTDAPYTFTQQEAVTEYRFTVHMKIEWIDLSNDEILIQKNFSDEQAASPLAHLKTIFCTPQSGGVQIFSELNLLY